MIPIFFSHVCRIRPGRRLDGYGRIQWKEGEKACAFPRRTILLLSSGLTSPSDGQEENVLCCVNDTILC